MSAKVLAALALAALLAALPARAQGPLPPAELERAVYAYADRYAMHVTAACEQIARGNPSAEQRRIAHLVQLGSASSIYDIATEADPFVKLIDLLMMVTLQSYAWIDEDRAEREFGARAEPLIRALRQMRVDAWKLAARVLRPDQLQRADALILDWRRRNPDLQILAYVRFSDPSMERGREALQELKPDASWFGIGQATKAVDEARHLAERAFFQAKRMPTILNWQMEAVLNEALAKPELAQALSTADSVTRAAERITAAAQAVPAQLSAEREALVAVLEDRSGRLSGLLGEVRKTTAAADQLAASALKLAESGERLSANLRAAVTTLDAIDARHARFDIEPYVRATMELNQAVAGINASLASVERLLEKDAGGQIDRVFLWAIALLAAFFGLLLAYRVLASRIAQ
jgi:hypothetical protein